MLQDSTPTNWATPARQSLKSKSGQVAPLLRTLQGPPRSRSPQDPSLLPSLQWALSNHMACNQQRALLPEAFTPPAPGTLSPQHLPSSCSKPLSLPPHSLPCPRYCSHLPTRTPPFSTPEFPLPALLFPFSVTALSPIFHNVRIYNVYSLFCVSPC